MRLVFLAATLLFCSTASGQVVVREGKPPVKEVTYASPVVIEAPVTIIADMARDSTRLSGTELIKGFETIVCDNVTINHVVVDAGRPDKNGDQEVRLVSTLSVRRGVDKWVTLSFDFLVEGKSVGKGRITRIDAEERKTTTKTATMSVNTKTLDPKVPMTLVITMAVADNP